MAPSTCSALLRTLDHVVALLHGVARRGHRPHLPRPLPPRLASISFSLAYVSSKRPQPRVWYSRACSCAAPAAESWRRLWSLHSFYVSTC